MGVPGKGLFYFIFWIRLIEEGRPTLNVTGTFLRRAKEELLLVFVCWPSLLTPFAAGGISGWCQNPGTFGFPPCPEDTRLASGLPGLPWQIGTTVASNLML